MISWKCPNIHISYDEEMRYSYFQQCLWYRILPYRYLVAATFGMKKQLPLRWCQTSWCLEGIVTIKGSLHIRRKSPLKEKKNIVDIVLFFIFHAWFFNIITVYSKAKLLHYILQKETFQGPILLPRRTRTTVPMSWTQTGISLSQKIWLSSKVLYLLIKVYCWCQIKLLFYCLYYFGW